MPLLLITQKYHIWSLKKCAIYTELYECQILIRESCFIHLAQFPRCFITWRQENC